MSITYHNLIISADRDLLSSTLHPDIDRSGDLDQMQGVTRTKTNRRIYRGVSSFSS